MAIINGTESDKNLTGTPEADSILGSGGKDTTNRIQRVNRVMYLL